MRAIIAFFLLTLVLGDDSPASSITITGTAYDFINADYPSGFPDFNSFGCGVQPGMVEDDLGSDNKPVLAGNGQNCVTSADTFNQWFRPSANNLEFPVQLTTYWDDTDKSYKYRNDYFFPLDGIGFGNENKPHNYGFCFEFHSQFTYESGQIFDFKGDDDVWVFIAGKLAIDLGGVHGAAAGTAYLDQLSLTEGNNYALDFFFCERHQSESTLWFSTSIELDPCGTTDKDNDGFPDKCDNCPNGDISLDISADDQIGSNNAVTFYVSLGKVSIQNAVTVSIDFGDGEDTQLSITSDSSVTHTYAKAGEYDVTASIVAATGCGGDATGTVSVKCGGKRVAPKCSELSAVPGNISKRKRSL